MTRQLSGLVMKRYRSRFEVAATGLKALLEHMGCYVGPDHTGLAYIVTKDSRRIAGPASCEEDAMLGAVRKITNKSIWE